MKKTTIFLCLLVALCSCGVRKSQTFYDYNSRIIATELDGSYTIRAFGKGRNAADAYVQARKQAVYDVVFNGVESTDKNIRSLKPLMLEVNAKDKYASYFNTFFADGGEFEKYCSMKEKRLFTTNYSRNHEQSMGEVTVCVFVDKLIEKLKQDNILK